MKQLEVNPEDPASIPDRPLADPEVWIALPTVRYAIRKSGSGSGLSAGRSGGHDA